MARLAQRTKRLSSPGTDQPQRKLRTTQHDSQHNLHFQTVELPQKRRWLVEEDKDLNQLITASKHGTVNWSAIASHFVARTAKQCRQRWLEHVCPDVRKDEWTADEDRAIMQLVQKIGPKWAKISKLGQLVGRSDSRRVSAAVYHLSTNLFVFLKKTGMTRTFRTDNAIKNRYVSLVRHGVAASPATWRSQNWLVFSQIDSQFGSPNVSPSSSPAPNRFQASKAPHPCSEPTVTTVTTTAAQQLEHLSPFSVSNDDYDDCRKRNNCSSTSSVDQINQPFTAQSLHRPQLARQKQLGALEIRWRDAESKDSQPTKPSPPVALPSFGELISSLQQHFRVNTPTTVLF
eukprot:c11395_g1_i1.p1 GENE.c11395_g1_i1~~c11395_g1_i1.p1  ORF type:complete len:345 (+),score=61.69 c11395_g1_i1:73-1107(+)